MQNFILFKLTGVEIYRTKYIVYAFLNLIPSKQVIGDYFLFLTHFLCKF